MKSHQIILIAALLYSYPCVSMEEKTMPCLRLHARADRQTLKMMKRIGDPWKNYDPKKPKIQFRPDIYEQVQNEYKQETLTQSSTNEISEPPKDLLKK